MRNRTTPRTGGLEARRKPFPQDPPGQVFGDGALNGRPSAMAFRRARRLLRYASRSSSRGVTTPLGASEPGTPTPSASLTVEQLAARLGVARSTVCAHWREWGGYRLGTGEKAPIRFDQARLPNTPGRRTDPAPRASKPVRKLRRRRTGLITDTPRLAGAQDWRDEVRVRRCHDRQASIQDSSMSSAHTAATDSSPGASRPRSRLGLPHAAPARTFSPA